MKSKRLSRKVHLTRIMWRTLVCLSTLFGHCVTQTGYVICSLHSTFRQAANTDITVTCGAENIYLSILLCPIYFGGYNESSMALNERFNVPACLGVTDFGVSTPVLNFNISISEESISTCGSSLVIIDQVDIVQLSTVSRDQFVNISGSVSSRHLGTDHQELLYQFSCRYLLHYKLNNTEVSMSGKSVAVKDNKGSFVSTLCMNLYTDQQYTEPLQVPEGGLHLQTRIYVQVKATNLTNRLNVLLDRCFATTHPYPANSTSYDLFAGCNHDDETVVDLNGVSQEARFSFEAFRFTEHQNMTISTFYLHCITRLCESSTCSSMLPNCVKLRREAQSSQNSSDVEIVSSGPIKTREESATSSLSATDNTVAGVVVLICLLIICSTGLAVFIMVYRMRRCVLHY